MKARRFLSVVPKVVQYWALAIACCAAPVGLVVGYNASAPGAAVRTMSRDGAAALVTGVVVATWLLCLGFVFADARRRAMPPVLWTLVAFLVPNLLGFLLYFAIRRPLSVSCQNCGRAISAEQLFCSWCGSSRSQPPNHEDALSKDISSVGFPVK